MINRPVCTCGNVCKPNGYNKDKTIRKYYKVCSSCQKLRVKQGKPGNQGGVSKGLLRMGSKMIYSKLKKDICEDCGFIAIHSCQLDVDHIDGNMTNNSPTNLKTLCANCHRIKTYMNKDWC